jgi:peptidoglycan/xylan/chitin deacetylase (PgdA/CDA1 family)
MELYFTNDVEHTGMNGRTWERIAQQVDEVTLPMLLDLYDKYNVKSTFFVLGQIAELRPNVVKQIIAHNQEVGSHGLQHDRARAFDVMSLEDQISELKQSKDLLEQITGTPVVSFRAPALRVNADTPVALREAGFLFDSSVAPQRLDAFMSYGAKGKRKWLKAPRAIYETAIDNLARRGDSGITEVPVSAFGIPYIGTVMRIAPYSLLPMTRRLLYWETKRKDTPISFLFHPNEAVEEIDEEKAAPLGKSGIKKIFSDVLRAKVKVKHLDLSALPLLERELKFWSEHGAEFKMVNQAKVK